MAFRKFHSRTRAVSWSRCAALLCAVTVLAACGPSVKTSWNTARMTPASPRVAEALANKLTVCFDRFVIDVPEGTKVVWGGHSAPLDVSIAPGRAQDLLRVVADREAELKAQPRYPRTKNLNLYFETLDGVLPGMKHVISQQNFDSEGILRIDTYFAMGTSLVSMVAGVLVRSTEGEDKQSVLEIANDMAQRLRPRDNYEVPTEPGLCLDNAFLADPAEPRHEERGNFLNVGFRLAVFPDVHLSVSLAPTNPNESAQWSLDNQLRISEEGAARDGRPNPFGELTFLRRAKRVIGDWKDGFEAITVVPDQPTKKVLSYQDFLMRFRGQADKWLYPYIDIAMQTGAGDQRVGQVKPTLSHDEGIALWDAITDSIRVRPTGPKRAANGLPIKAALGERATTGRKCPQAGWWECVDDLPLAEPRGRFFCEGDLMPGIEVWRKPTALDRLRGKRRQHRMPTEWRLTSYEGPVRSMEVSARSASTEPPVAGPDSETSA